MTKLSVAIRMAEYLDSEEPGMADISAELRRLDAENQRLMEDILAVLKHQAELVAEREVCVTLIQRAGLPSLAAAIRARGQQAESGKK